MRSGGANAALARLLPDARESDLLAAALLDGDPAREAWDRWAREAGGQMSALAADTRVARTLLPLLCDSVRRNALAVDRETATYLRSALLRESLRSRAYREIVCELDALLERARIPFLLVKGAAVGVAYYPDLALRHAHDIEILVAADAPVSNALLGSRFRAAGRDWVDPSGLPLRVHTRLFVPGFEYDELEVWNAATPIGSSGRTPGPAHSLALALVHAGRSISRESCRWVCDAQAIVRGGGVDWDRFTGTVVAVGAALPVSVQLLWLQRVLGIGVPRQVLDSLEEHVARASAAEMEAVTRGLYCGSFHLWRGLWAETDARFRGLLIKSAIMPSSAVLGARAGHSRLAIAKLRAMYCLGGTRKAIAAAIRAFSPGSERGARDE